MKNVQKHFFLMFLLCLPLGLSACASRAPTATPVPVEGKLPPPPTFPSWRGDHCPIYADFTARVSQASDVPLQGRIQLHPFFGGFPLVTAFGRTVGECRYKPFITLTSDENDAEEVYENMLWTCTPAPDAPGGQKNAAYLLSRVVQAVYTALSKSLVDYHTDGLPISSLQPFRYEDNLGAVDIHFKQIWWKQCVTH